MRALDWVVLVGTLAAIVAYGAWKSRQVNDAEAWLRGGRDLRWWTIGLSIMATQASAVTFLSTPGQAYEDGMGFVQFYFGDRLRRAGAFAYHARPGGVVQFREGVAHFVPPTSGAPGFTSGPK